MSYSNRIHFKGHKKQSDWLPICATLVDYIHYTGQWDAILTQSNLFLKPCQILPMKNCIFSNIRQPYSLLNAQEIDTERSIEEARVYKVEVVFTAGALNTKHGAK